MKPNWRDHTDLPEKCWITSVAELNESIHSNNIYVEGSSETPYVYSDLKQNEWFVLLPLPWKYRYFSLVAVYEIKCIMAIGGVNKNETRIKCIHGMKIAAGGLMNILIYQQHKAVLHQFPINLL